MLGTAKWTPVRLPMLQQVWPASAGDGASPPGDRLTRAYGEDLRIPRQADRPTVIVNFVSTLDGVVSFATPEAAGGGEISGFSAADRMVMGLLRAQADAVLVGAGTVRAAPTEAWTANAVYPPAADEYAATRRREGLTPQPLTVVVTARGDVDLAHPGLALPDVPVLIVTTEEGARRLGSPPAHVAVAATEGPRVDPSQLIATLGRRGVRLVLCEGGPHLLGDLLSADLVDELFLTVAPQIAGRSAGNGRLGLVEGTAFDVADAPWWQLVSMAHSGSHLFLRYRRRHNTDHA